MISKQKSPQVTLRELNLMRTKKSSAQTTSTPFKSEEYPPPENVSLKKLRDLFSSKGDLVYFGLACPQIWLSFMFQSLTTQAPYSVEIFYASRGLFLLVIAGVFFFKKYSSDITAGFLSWGIIPLMTLAPFIASASLPFDPRVTTTIAALAGGVGIVWTYLPYVLAFSKLNALKIASVTLLSFAIASILRFPINLLPFNLVLFVISPLPFLSVFLGNKAIERSKVAHKNPRQKNEINLKSLVPVAIELAIYGIAVGMIRLSSEGTQYETTAYTVHLIFRIIFPLALLWWIYAQHKTISISRMCQIALLFIITALVLLSFLNGENSSFASAATTCARTSIIILLWLILALLAHRSSLHPYVVFGVGWALYMLSITAGMLIGDAIGTEALINDSLALNLVYFLVVSTILIFTFRNEGRAKLFSEEAVATTANQNNTENDALYQKIANQYNLTKREFEVMQYICKGRSKGFIAKDLMISENTVRGYAKNLYAKLGIHSRQELLSLLENA